MKTQLNYPVAIFFAFCCSFFVSFAQGQTADMVSLRDDNTTIVVLLNADAFDEPIAVDTFDEYGFGETLEFQFGVIAVNNRASGVVYGSSSGTILGFVAPSPDDIDDALVLIDNDTTKGGKQDHILQTKHLWGKAVAVVSWPNIRPIVEDVVRTGTDHPHKGVRKKVKTLVNGEIVEVTYTTVNGKIRISDAWVKK